MKSSTLTLPRWIVILLFLINQIEAFTPSSYLDSLSRRIESSEETHDALISVGMPAEEYYGHTNPMANNWPGSKHEAGGGYLKRLDAKNQQIQRDEPPDEWYGKGNTMASWQGYKHPRFGGYLDTLQPATEVGFNSSTLPAGKTSNYGSDVRWGVDVYLSSIQPEQSKDEKKE